MEPIPDNIDNDDNIENNDDNIENNIDNIDNIHNLYTIDFPEHFNNMILNQWQPVPEPETEPEPEIEPHTPVILQLPVNISNLLAPPIHQPIHQPGSLEERVIQESFHSEPKYKQVCDKDFINSLSVQKVTPEMAVNRITCGICLDELQVGDDVIELPCRDTHYFHIQREECPGIYPWLKDNHTCPLCRHEFPSEEKQIERTNQEPTLQEAPPVERINLMSIITNAIQDHEERLLQQTILQSLHQ